MLVRTVTIKKQALNPGENVEKRETCTVGGIINWYSQYGKELGIPQTLELPCDLAISGLEYI